MYSERIAQNRLKKIKKELEEHFDKRNEHILDNIFEGKIIILGPENLIKSLVEKNVKIEEMRFEDKLTGYMFKEGRNEFHTLYLAEKDEDLRKFLIGASGDHDISLDKLVGFSIFNDDTNYGILYYDLKYEEYSRSNVKKMIERVLPKADDMFNSVVKDSMQQISETIMLSTLADMATRDKKRVAK